ncbi:MAG TPA: GTPase HflX [Lapidilactobacillus dextrinicus]|uniref:GTPase HflX n=1 Tax=Lapidilactobacillus dextrinicus TaxID=51664 RepID=A0A921DTU0_9LACO|nr:GTPase HflX [Lapidilactobacillus dextrinicus]
MAEIINLQTEKERVLIGGLNRKAPDFDYTMNELKELAKADNMEVVDQVVQNLDRMDAATYFGSGKVQEIAELANGLDIQTFVINDELSPSQIANLEKETKLRIVDRTELILEIFADRAQTKEAKTQVEIARLQYELPRIHPSANSLDQQHSGGGGGLRNRGAGETQSELDRRVIRKRISDLKQNLKALEKSAATQRERRQQSGLPKVALVGYTNAGKSTTMNQLLARFDQLDAEKKQVFEKDMLFATLDTSVRTIQLPNKQQFLLSDTVGFVSHLPHNLVASFKSTLAEAADADLLIQVVDYSDPNYREMMTTTTQTLNEIGINNIPMIVAFNKADLRPDTNYPEGDGDDFIYSAKNPASIDALAKLITKHIFAGYHTVNLMIPFSESRILAELEAHTSIIEKDYTELGTQIKVVLDPIRYNKYQKFIQ